MKARSVLAALAIAMAACERPVDECFTMAATAPIIARSPDRPAAEVAADTVIRLTLNIPAYRVAVLDDDVTVGQYTVAVGSPRYRTRVGTYTITSITWNPWWVPPASDWARGEKKTAPGPYNPMGKVKINFGPAYYLHGTPDSLRLGRALSHGCVRMQNSDAVDLALYLQNASGAPLTGTEQADLLAKWQPSKTVMLPRTFPLEIRYDVVELDDSVITIHRDVYDILEDGLVPAVLGRLTAAGITPEMIDTAGVEKFAREARKGGSAPIRTLLRE